MNLDKDRERLSQNEILKELQHRWESCEMVTVYQRPSENYQDYCIDSFLIPTDILRQPTINLDWDWEFDLVGMPLFVDPKDTRLYEGGELGFRANYRFDNRVKRLVLPRRFNAGQRCQMEICQDFCLFNNLYYDEETNNYIKFTDEGNEIIATVEPNCVKIRYKEIHWFLRAKNMYLSLRFDYREHSQYTLNDLGYNKGDTTVRTERVHNGSIRFNHFYSNDPYDNYWVYGEGLQANRLRNLFDYDKNFIEDKRETNYQKPRNIFYRTIDSDIIGLDSPYHQSLLPLRTPTSKDSYTLKSYSVLHGRKLIGLGDIPKQKSVKFIIHVNEYGTEITRSYDTYKHKTFAHFDKKVLDKYYHYHHTYRVGDTYLICQDRGAWLPNTEMGIWLTGDPRFLTFHGQWLIRIDDDHDNRVCVSLKELWKLPTEEQRHWRVYNIPPVGDISETYVTRYEKFQSMSSNRPEHLFRESYHRLQSTCEGKLYWKFLTEPLNIKNEYRLRCLRIPSDFDTEYHLFLSLEIILNESLKLGKSKTRKRLEKIQDATKHLDFLGKVNDWRNEWDGHLGPDDYLTPDDYVKNVKKMGKDFGVNSQNLRDIYTQVLRKAVDLLEFLNKAAGGNQP